MSGRQVCLAEQTLVQPAANGRSPPLLAVILGNVDGSFRPIAAVRAYFGEGQVCARVTNASSSSVRLERQIVAARGEQVTG
jgi:hypothetical protein